MISTHTHTHTHLHTHTHTHTHTRVHTHLDRKKLAPSLTQCIIPAGRKLEYTTYANNLKGVELDIRNVSDIVADDTSGIEKEAPKRKSPSKDAYLRWIAMGLFVFVSSFLLLILIILIGLPA